MLLYWGRRGAMTQFTLQAARAVRQLDGVLSFVSVSRQNEDFAAYEELGASLFPVDTFDANSGVLTRAWRIPLLRRRLAARLRTDRIQTVIDMMPHVWAPFVIPAIRSAGVRYVAVAHDAGAHPGDWRALLKNLEDRALFGADHVIALSEAVTQRLVASGGVPKHRIATLFHPDLGYARPAMRPLQPGAPLRLLFLGRIMRYKGLSLFCDMIEQLRASGIAVAPGVFGEGPLGRDAVRLAEMGAEVVNRWLTPQEIADALGRYDCLVACHTEASQSGVVAAAFGAGLPVIVNPVGGLVEQVEDGVTGIVAERADAAALADAAKRLVLTPGLHEGIHHRIVERAGDRSMARFVRECIDVATGPRSLGSALPLKKSLPSPP